MTKFDKSMRIAKCRLTGDKKNSPPRGQRMTTDTKISIPAITQKQVLSVRLKVVN